MLVTQEEFEAAVKRGLGRAVLWLRHGKVVPDRDFLLYACIHNLAYDRQSEDNRALYMFDMIQATSEPEFYTRAVQNTLAAWDGDEEDNEDPVSVYQMFDLLGLLAKQGDSSARQSLYSFFEKHAQFDAVREEVLVEIDGLDGYLFVIRQWLKYPQPEEDDQRFDYLLLDTVEKRFGTEHVQAFLEQTSQDNALRAYLTEVREKHTAWKTRLKSRPKRHWPDYAEIQQLISDTKKRCGPTVWARYGEHLSAADAEQMAQDLLAETDPRRLKCRLLLFKRRPFPLSHEPLLTMAQSTDREVASAARAALGQIAHPAVRILALELMDTDKRPDELIEMLTLNFQAGDEKAIEHVLSKPWDANELHWLTLDVRNLAAANPQPALAGALMRLYEEGCCTMCRYGVIELLEKLDPLPPYILEEGHFDAYDGTRELAAEQMQKFDSNL